MDASSKGQLFYQDTTAFGSLTALAGSGTVFGFGGANGCQTDADTGLVLMGHRYYDTRIGRFISQDHAKSGGNWYAYCDNDPMDGTDPSGLSTGLPGTLGAPNQRYGGFYGSDPFELFGENNTLSGKQSNGGNFQIGTEQGTAQQNQGSAIPSTDLIFISQGMMHPAPIIVDDGIFSIGYGGEVLLGTHKYTLSGGLAIDLYKRQFKFTLTVGHYNGIGLGSSRGPYIGLGTGTLGGYNGFSSGYNADLGKYGGVAYDYNAGYKGITYSPSFLSTGLAGGAFMGIVGANNASRGGSFTFPSPTYQY